MRVLGGLLVATTLLAGCGSGARLDATAVSVARSWAAESYVAADCAATGKLQLDGHGSCAGSPTRDARVVSARIAKPCPPPPVSGLPMVTKFGSCVRVVVATAHCTVADVGVALRRSGLSWKVYGFAVYRGYTGCP